MTAINLNANSQSMIANVTYAATLAANRFVGADGNYASAGATPYGVTSYGGDSGETLPCQQLGECTVEAGGAISANALIAVGSNGKAVALTTQEYGAGYALEAASGDGEFILINLNVKTVAPMITADEIGTGAVTETKIGTGAVTADKIGADAVDGTKIADDAIDSEHIADGSIDAAHLSADCVNGDKIADDSIDSEHITDGSIDAAHLSADCVNGDNIADDSIDSEHIVDGAIDAAHLSADCVNGDKIADDAVDSEHIVDGAIDTAHIADAQITNAKLAENARSLHTIKISVDADELAAGSETTLLDAMTLGYPFALIALDIVAESAVTPDGSGSASTITPKIGSSAVGSGVAVSGSKTLGTVMSGGPYSSGNVGTASDTLSIVASAAGNAFTAGRLGIMATIRRADTAA